MIQPLPRVSIQFEGVYSPEKARRLVEELNRYGGKINEIIGQLDDDAPTEIPVADHVLATTVSLGEEHTVSGLTAGMVLKATAATDAAFGRLRFSDLAQVDANTFNTVENGDVLVFVDGYYSMLPGVSLLGVADPAADAVLSWDVDVDGFSWRLPGFGITLTTGTIAVDIDEILEAVSEATPPQFYPRFLLMGA